MEPADFLLLQIRTNRLPEPIRELVFAQAVGRRFRFDFSWARERVACEFEGGSFTGGGHTRGKHFESDLIKYAIAQLLGWTVLRVNGHMVEDGRAILLIEAALGLSDCGDAAAALAARSCEQCMTKQQKIKRMAKGTR